MPASKQPLHSSVMSMELTIQYALMAKPGWVNVKPEPADTLVELSGKDIIKYPGSLKRSYHP